MPLTPDDIVHKKFETTKFREGFDQDDVNDFLDEVVGEFRRLIEENERFRRQLGELGVAVEPGAGSAGTDGLAGAAAEADPAAASIAGSTPTGEATPAASAPAPSTSASSTPDVTATVEPTATPLTSAAPTTASATPGDVAGMLALAQRLHDEHVRDGETQRDTLLAEAQETAARLVREAEETQAQTLGSLEKERSVLERTIDELRGFEREYRSRLKSYLENQLRDLDTKGQVVPSAGGTS